VATELLRRGSRRYRPVLTLASVHFERETDMSDEPDRITSIEALEALYGAPHRRSLVKETARITAEYRRLIEASPFVAVASAGPEGLDCSPRGDAAPVVTVLDETSLALPDRLGNNRTDTLRNVIRDPRIALMFLIPGAGEAVRVNGTAAVTVAPALLDRFAVDGKRPRSVMLVTVACVYFQCARAIIRSGLWEPSHHVDRATLPTAGEITAALDNEPFDAKSYDEELPARQRRTLY